MEWLKKHWGWIAAIAVGIPVLYWLYQTYQTDAANNAQNAQQTDLQNQEEADAASYAQQIALGDLSGGIGSESSSTPVTTTVSSGSAPVVSTPTVSSGSVPVVSTPSVSSSSSPVVSSVVNTLLGRGTTARSPVSGPTQVPNPIHHIASGTIPQHNTTLPTPTTSELSSIGFHPGGA